MKNSKGFWIEIYKIGEELDKRATKLKVIAMNNLWDLIEKGGENESKIASR